ncbi:MAG: hypothetical protein ACK4GB_03315 [Tepidimonas sp.]
MKSERWRLGALLALVYGLWAIGRLVVTPALEFDEAEQVLHRQALLPVYGAQPPLFEWLVAALCGLFPLSALQAVMVVKVAALWAIGMGTASVVEQLTRRPRAATAAGWWALTPTLLLWDAPRTLTHSLLATASVVGVLAASAPLLRGEAVAMRPMRWLVLGMAITAALMSKYNTAIALGACGLLVLMAGRRSAQAAAVAQGREAVMPWARGIVWMAVGLVPLAWHASVVMRNWDVIQAPIAEKMLSGVAHGPWHGVVELVVAWIGHLALPLGMLWVLTRRWPRQPAVATVPASTVPPWGCYALLYSAVVASAMGAMVAAGVLTDVRERWVMPLAAPLLALLAAWAAPAIERHSGAIQATAAGLVITGLTLLLWRPWWLAQHGAISPNRLPVQEVAAWVDRLGPDDAVVVARPIQLAGALAAYGQRGRRVLYRESSLPVWESTRICAIVVVDAAAALTHANRLSAVGFAPAGPVVRSLWPHRRLPGSGLSVEAQVWTYPQRPCPQGAAVYHQRP